MGTDDNEIHQENVVQMADFLNINMQEKQDRMLLMF